MSNKLTQKQQELRDRLAIFNEYKATYINRRIMKKESTQTRIDMLYSQYDFLLEAFDLSNHAPTKEKIHETEMWITNECKTFMLPQIELLIENKKLTDAQHIRLYELWEKTLALTSRRSFHHFLIYMELDRTEKRRVYLGKRDVILKPFAYYFEKMMYSEDFKFLSDSKPPSSGKCSTPSTPIFTPKGKVLLGDIQVGDEVYSMKDRQVVIETVTNKWYTQKKQYKIKTKGGKELILSPEHKMFTDKGYKQAQDLTTNDYLYRLNSKTELGKELDITDDELIFLTCMLFDGHCKGGRLRFTKEPNEIYERFIEVLDNKSWSYVAENKNNSKADEVRIHANNNEPYELLKRFGIADKLSCEKSLPNEFFTMSNRQKMIFLGVMFATDGYVSRNDVGITLSNEELIDDIQLLLDTVGVYSCKGYKKSKCNDKHFDAWRLTIPRDIAAALMDEIYIYQKEDNKQDLVIETIIDRRNTSVRYPFSLLDDLEPCGKKKKNGNHFYHEELRMERKNDRSLHKMEDFFRIYPELECERYKDFFYEPIISIEYIDEEIQMVDIEVSNTHNFIANSYVSHNSFSVNYATAWCYGLNVNSSILRMSVAEDNVMTASQNIKEIIQDKRFADVFPYFKRDNIFSISKLDGWKIEGADVEKSHMGVPMGGQIEGKRANTLIIVDDSLKQDDAGDENLMAKNWQKYLTSISARSDGELAKELLIGTMWHPDDLLGKKIEYEMQDSEVREGKFKYTKEIWRNGKLVGAVIQTPQLDPETDETTCVHVMSTETARKRRSATDPFLWASAYQQDPIPPKGRAFAYEELRTYDSYHKDYVKVEEDEIELSEYSQMAIDPTRRGIDNVSCPIFKTDNNKGEDHYLIDAIFRGKAMDEVYDIIVDKVFIHNVNLIVLENNTDTSLKYVLENKIKERNRALGRDMIVEIREKYSTERKEKRIKDESFAITQRLIFPKRGLYPPNSDMGKFMSNVNRFSFEKPNKHDDAPDSLALYVKEIIKKTKKSNKVKAISAKSFWG